MFLAATLALVFDLVLIHSQILQGVTAFPRKLFEGVAAALAAFTIIREFRRVHAELEALLLKAFEPVKPAILEEIFH